MHLKIFQVEILRKPFLKAKYPVVGWVVFNRWNVIKLIVAVNSKLLIVIHRFWHFDTFTLIHRFGIKASNQKF